MLPLAKNIFVALSLIVLMPCDCGRVFGQEPPVLDWNRTDKYVAPDFESYFVDDEAGGKVLDSFDVRAKDKDLSEVIAVLRAGLRRTKRHQTTILGNFGNRFIWGKDVQAPEAMELMYHASDAPRDTGHYARYHGLTVANKRSDNLMRTLVQRYHSYTANEQRRIGWGFKTYGDQADTAKRLETALLAVEADKSIKDRELAILAAMGMYEDLVGEPIANAKRFDLLGTFVIGFSHEGTTTLDGLRSQLEQWSGNDQAIKEFVLRRDNGVVVGVALMKGIGYRTQVQAEIEGDVAATLVFAETFKDSVLQYRQLREFAKHLPNGLPERARPKYIELPEGEEFDWQAKEYRAPDFFAFFPDDELAGKALDQAFANQEELDMTAREILELIQQGLRRTKVGKNQVMSWVSRVSGWPSDPFAKEIAYQALDMRAPGKWRYNAIYFGARNWKDRSPNVLKAMSEILIHQPFELGSNETRSYVEWGLRNSPKEKEVVARHLDQALAGHKDLSFSELFQVNNSYEEMTERKPSSFDEYSKRGAVFFGLSHSEKEGAELLKQVQADFGEETLFLEAVTPMGRGKQKTQPPNNSVVVVVKGIAGVEWIKSELKLRDEYRPWIAMPIVPQLFEKEVEWFEPLKKYLEDE